MGNEMVKGITSGNKDCDIPISIDRLIEDMEARTSTSTDRNIFKVPEHLRSVNPNAYDPHLIAIGPYHRNNDLPSKMKDHKMEFLKEFLERKKKRGEDLKKILEALTAVEQDARDCYAEDATAHIGSDEFLEMMLLDGCFILVLLRRLFEGDTLPFSRSIIKKLRRDLLLFENQLPFVVLQKLFGNKTPNEPSLEQMILYFFHFPPFPEAWSHSKSLIESDYIGKKHLLSFIHDYWLLCCAKKKIPIKEKYPSHRRFMRCVTELKEAGIKFKNARGGSLFDIKFERGIMKIPRLEITEETDSIYRNFVVYEQYCLDENDSKSRRVISDYMKFMDCLVNSHKDVEVLCQRNSLHNCLGNDEKVADMFNSIGDFGTLSPDNHYYGMFLKVNYYCDQKRHRWIAHLRHKYFNTPWAFVSFFAAVLLLLLTVAQTVYSVLGFYIESSECGRLSVNC